MELILKRVLFTDDGVTGVLVFGNREICRTLEEEWKFNEKNLSCIPAGTYLCKRVKTPKHGETFEVMEVPGRSAILFHSGKTEINTLGCILLGMEVGEINAQDDDTGIVEKQLAILKSKEAFEKFMAVLDGKASFLLTIRLC